MMSLKLGDEIFIQAGDEPADAKVIESKRLGAGMKGRRLASLRRLRKGRRCRAGGDSYVLLRRYGVLRLVTTQSWRD